jgi:hypothetical protein
VILSRDARSVELDYDPSSSMGVLTSIEMAPAERTDRVGRVGLAEPHPNG